MSSNENSKFDKIHAIIICQDNGENINFALHFSVDQQTSMAILNALYEHLTNLLKKPNEEKNTTPH
jgi:hypothetical protein